MKIKFNKELLLSLFPKEGKAKLIGLYDNVNGKSKIKYKCADCEEDGEKYLSRLYASGTYCKNVHIKGAQRPVLKLYRKNMGHI